MIAHPQLTTRIPADYKARDLSSTALSLVQTSLLLLQVDDDLARDEDRMAHSTHRSRSREHDSELWFSMPSAARREACAPSEPSAYHATASGHSTKRSTSPGRFPTIPIISTTAALNKPLPSPPSPESGRRRHKPAALRSLIRGRTSERSDPTHLQPSPHQHQRSSSDHRHLSTPQQPALAQSRSTPSSPADFARAYQSTTPNMYAPVQYQAYPSYHYAYPPASINPNAPFEPQPPRTRRTFPDSTTSPNTTGRDSISDRQRPHTWLSPTETFDNSSLHLFAEATCGLPGDDLGSNTMSPTSPPHLQSSLFARVSQNDRIPLPMQNQRSHSTSAAVPSLGYDFHPQQPPVSMSASALPRRDSYQSYYRPTSAMNAVNLELERLGLSDEEPEEELPGYEQSQAEMNAKRRREATARARELEARWNSSRGGRSR